MTSQTHDLEAEQATLGAMLQSPAVAEQVRRVLVSADFYRPAHAIIFEQITGMLAENVAVDVIALNARLQERGLDSKTGHAPYLHTIIASVPIVASGPAYAAIVRKHAITRRLREAGSRIMQWTGDDQATEDPAGLTERILRELEATRAEGTGVADITAKPSDDFINTPLADDEYDWVIPNLLERKDRLILTGFEGAGKSTLFRQLAVMTAAGIHPFRLFRFRPGRCLLLDFENSERHTRRKLWPLLQTAMTATEGNFDFRNLWIECRTGGVDLSADKGVSWLLQQVSALKPDIVFLGPLYKLAPRALNDDTDAAPVLAALDMIRERNACVVLEAHAGHAVGPGGKRDLRVRGSAAFMGWPEFAYGLRWADGSTRERRVVEFSPWRTDRDERQWPEKLEQGSPWPWCEAAPEGASFF